MAKYSKEFKLKIVNEYLQGTLGYRSLAKTYQIPSSSQIETWVRQYKQEGTNGLQPKEKQTYTLEFKLNVLNDMKITGASYSQTAIHFGISDIGTIANWKATLLKDGVEALVKRKGRPHNPMTKLKTSKESKTLTREQQLEEEIKLLRIENEY
ncbi:MAG: helix-turn-helix domain-containing protein [Turicibacter sp.]|nr:helix-turn-helix domain-containing protein [Turicibacter sp.]